jgi:predicted component of type VI protein secretion system
MAVSTVRSKAPRYRLRFLRQEFNLPFGITTIGRGDDCHITLFDTSVSRRHARIIVDDRCAILEDLRSRNGCRVNGKRIRGPTMLWEGDRIRIGTQELVFGTASETSHVQRRNTGSLCYCASCRAAYAAEMKACPQCGSTQQGPSATSEEDDPIEPTEPTTDPRRRRSVPPPR